MSTTALKIAAVVKKLDFDQVDGPYRYLMTPPIYLQPRGEYINLYFNQGLRISCDQTMYNVDLHCLYSMNSVQSGLHVNHNLIFHGPFRQLLSLSEIRASPAVRLVNPLVTVRLKCPSTTVALPPLSVFVSWDRFVEIVEGLGLKERILPVMEFRRYHGKNAAHALFTCHKHATGLSEWSITCETAKAENSRLRMKGHFHKCGISTGFRYLKSYTDNDRGVACVVCLLCFTNANVALMHILTEHDV
ncbi:hypothetical protein BU23DRAFT_297641 [Bimuria novae-zelandiae CBS 107.79]|uniref:Uncharacterized protein n=1 Tax=Bimuria novae-zelandiae CBS 107.79 TaxID=1447943 RepID=A0A6A5VP46_9PLEO|nr:hypothetical protein BU23DRAFT_297641 [Bimuria novae-zelandiae CBS 107.79]